MVRQNGPFLLGYAAIQIRIRQALNIAFVLCSRFTAARESRIHPPENLAHVLPTNLHPVPPSR
ncbi:hypothetical protein, partial [Neisseria meningitidis]|uniref:hypothetical protein n=1 Tax=Neisseria meningitidis TaxID=487 RepID=UPI0021F2297E